MLQQIIVNSFSLSLDGLSIAYSKGANNFTIQYDPLSACDLFESLKMIEGFDKDRHTGEPVILFEKERDNGEGMWDTTTGYSEWHQFVKTFPMCEAFARLLVEHKESTDHYQALIAKIDSLLFSKSYPHTQLISTL